MATCDLIILTRQEVNKCVHGTGLYGIVFDDLPRVLQESRDQRSVKCKIVPVNSECDGQVLD